MIDPDKREESVQSELPWFLVKKIRLMYKRGELSTHRLAKITGLSQYHIWKIVNYRKRIVDTRPLSLNQQRARAEKRRGKRTWARMDRTKILDEQLKSSSLKTDPPDFNLL